MSILTKYSWLILQDLPIFSQMRRVNFSVRVDITLEMGQQLLEYIPSTTFLHYLTILYSTLGSTYYYKNIPTFFDNPTKYSWYILNMWSVDEVTNIFFQLSPTCHFQIGHLFGKDFFGWHRVAQKFYFFNFT